MAQNHREKVAAKRAKDPRRRLKDSVKLSIYRSVPKKFLTAGNYPGGRFSVEYFTGTHFKHFCEHVKSLLQ
jgi:hypothetical protein